MTVTQDTEPAVVTRCRVLAEVLGLGLPAPSLISIYSGTDVRLQFNDRDEVAAWAAHFGVETVSSKTEGGFWCDADFACDDVDFFAYAKVAAR